MLVGDRPSPETSEVLAEGYGVPAPSADEQSSINALGLDALAYYAPFHFYIRAHWGIYIRDYGIAYLASQFLGRMTLRRSDNWALRCAYWLLLEHERFHFQTEIAATRYEVLTHDTKAYERIFQDGHTAWLEEAMANASAYRELASREDGTLTFSRIEHFSGFASSWMKTQGTGYRDYDRWCRSASTMHKGRAALVAKIHEASPNFSQTVMGGEVLRLYENAYYSRVPVIRIHDTRIPWLKSGRLFPKAHGLQVMVYTRDHPPPHIHVEFLDSDRVVRLGWPSLSPLRGEPSLSAQEERDLRTYLGAYGDNIGGKVQKVFQQPSLAHAV